MHAGIYRFGCIFAASLVTDASARGSKGLQEHTSFQLRSSSLLVSQEDWKERVFICNAFVDEQPIMVSSEKGAHGSELAYKQCEHYDLDLQNGIPLLLQPAEADEAVDALSFKDAPTVEGCGNINTTCVAIIHRRGRRSPKGTVQWLHVPQSPKQPKIATVDAYALAGDDVARGLAAAGIPGINSAAVFRIEDKLNPQLELSRQVVASRTLSLGRVYSATPGRYHLVLEDLKGSTMVGYEDISLAKGGKYIMMRVGEPGSKEYPEQLVFRTLVEPHSQSGTNRREVLAYGNVLMLMAIFTLTAE